MGNMDLGILLFIFFVKKELYDCVSECLDNSVNNMDLGII